MLSLVLVVLLRFFAGEKRDDSGEKKAREDSRRGEEGKITGATSLSEHQSRHRASHLSATSSISLSVIGSYS